MAEPITKMPTPGGHIPVDDYPWTRWLVPDAKFMLRRGTDFDVAVLAFRAYVYRGTALRGRRVRTVRGVDGQSLAMHCLGIRTGVLPCSCDDGGSYIEGDRRDHRSVCLVCGGTWVLPGWRW